MERDKVIFDIIEREHLRQKKGIELIASENFVSDEVMQAMGSCLTNKYAEGYPGHRYYGGCQVVDEAETIAIERLKQLFDAEWANVQPHSGAQANMAVFMYCLKPGDKVLGMDLSNGGHLSHGSPVNFSGLYFDVASYGVDEDGNIDYEDVLKKAKEKILAKYPKAKIDLELHDEYRNMRDYFIKHMEAIELINKAYINSRLPIRYTPIRGGTDGATITYMGLPCPNFGTGSYNHHGKYEFASIQDMTKMVEIISNVLLMAKEVSDQMK